MKRGCRIFLFRPPPDEGRKRKMLVVDRRKSSREGSEDDQAPRLRVHLELRAPSSRIKHSQENEEGSLDKSGLIEGCRQNPFGNLWSAGTARHAGTGHLLTTMTD